MTGKPALERQVSYAFATVVWVLILILFAVESQFVWLLTRSWCFVSRLQPDRHWCKTCARATHANLWNECRCLRNRQAYHCRLLPIGRVVHADLLRNLGLLLQGRYRQDLELSRVRPSCQERKIQKIILNVTSDFLGLNWSPRINLFHRRRKKALFPSEKSLNPRLVTSQFSLFLLVPSKLIHRLRLMTFFMLPLKSSICLKIHLDCGKFVVSLFWRERLGTVSLFQ